MHNLYKFRLAYARRRARAPPISPSLRCVTRDFIAVGRIILVDDITDRIQLEAQLAQADKLSSIGLLAAGVAHEVNTPLAVISSYAQMLAKQMRGDDAPGAGAGEDHAADLPRLGDRQRPAELLAHQRRPSSREIDLNQVIRDTLTLLEHQFKTAQVDVELDLDAATCRPFTAIRASCSRCSSTCCSTPRTRCPAADALRVATLVNGHVEASWSATPAPASRPSI